MLMNREEMGEGKLKITFLYDCMYAITSRIKTVRQIRHVTYYFSEI